MKKVRKQYKRVAKLFPEDAKKLLSGTGKELVQRIGLDVIRGAVYNVLCGRNLRDSTEPLTRKKLITLNAAALLMLMNGKFDSQNLIEDITKKATYDLRRRLGKDERWILEWVLGLTDKAYQNILRDNPNILESYRKMYVKICKESIESCQEKYGPLNGILKLNSDKKAEMNWDFIVQLLSMVGAQTLAIRGSEKSLYGKLFERLILGSVLSIFGFKQISRDNPEKLSNVFWLTSRYEKRESDATLLLEAGKGVRFDIGFIGRGNPEISLDKVSRFEREIEFGRSKWYLATFIIVDSIGKKSRIKELAKRINGIIIQMSMAYWPKQVAIALNKTVGFKHKMVNMKEEKVGDYLKKAITKVPLMDFIEDTKI